MVEVHMKLNENGRVVIPSEMRSALGIEPGDELVMRIEDDELRIAALTAELVESLRDPKSRNFYRLVAQRMPEGLVFMTLSETKDAQRTGQIRKNAGAYFTHAIKVAAERLGVDLSSRAPLKARK